MRYRHQLATALAVAAAVSMAPARAEHAAQAPRAAAFLSSQSSAPSAAFSAEDVFSYPFPAALTAASRTDRIAWTLNEQGRRNIWVAEGPRFEPRRLTSYETDDGQELTSVSLSPSGEWVVYVRGGDHGANWDDQMPVNAMSMPVPPEVAIWAVPFAGGEPQRLGDGDLPVISPDGRRVAYERGNAIWIAPIDGSSPGAAAIEANGSNGSPVWSPDGSRVAFVSRRDDHAFVGVFSDAGTPITWIAPSTSRDDSPRWSPDGTRLVFVRRPGEGGPPAPALEARHSPWALWTADAGTGDGRVLWTAPETLRGSYPSTEGRVNLHWAAGNRIVYMSHEDGWPHMYSIPADGGDPLLLTPGDYMAEYISLSPDGTSLVFCANAGETPDDVDRRHIVRVPVDRAAPEVMTPGTGIEWTPVVTGGSGALAFISATAQRPPLPSVIPTPGATPVLVAEDSIPAAFPTTSLVTPTAVTFKASDGVTVHAQLFMPPGEASGRRPAIIYVHGGPPRQMLLGWHYSDYYARAYASNQYLASRGFIVMSVNYRLGIGYGYDFHRPAAAGARGASEYLDVKAGGEYLRSREDVDAARIGIYGGSYGGFLTALALGRNSDIFATGVDMHGVHDFTTRGSGSGAAAREAIDAATRADQEHATRVALESSPVSAVDTWKSPVLLIHGDNDRNVRFSQTVDLGRRLEAAGVTFEEIVVPDDTHHWMRHANALRVYKATAEWFERHFMAGPSSVQQ